MWKIKLTKEKQRLLLVWKTLARVVEAQLGS
jgi:hypothetical protein